MRVDLVLTQEDKAAFSTLVFYLSFAKLSGAKNRASNLTIVKLLKKKKEKKVN